MPSVAVRWLVAGLLLVGAVFGARELALAQEKKKLDPSHVDVLELARQVATKKITLKQAEDFRKKHDDLHDVMHIYHIKKGLGYEKRLLDLGKSVPMGAALAAEKDKLLELGYVNITMSELVRHYFEKPKGGKGKGDWNRHAEDQKKAAEEFIAAVKKLDPAGIKKAANKITDACENCHADFRP